MKQYILNCLFFCLFVIQAQAQSPFWVDSFTFGNATYKCEQEYGVTHLYNQQNLSRHRPLESYPKASCHMADVDYPKIRQVLHTVFDATQRTTFKANETPLEMTLYIKPISGSIDEISFYVGKNTPITQQQIYQLEQGLKGLVMPAKPLCVPMTWIVFPLTVQWE